jgi:hypothetical protein
MIRSPTYIKVRKVVESANLEVIKYENHNIGSYDFQVDNNVNIEPYTMFLHAMKSPVTNTCYEVSCYKD